MIPQNLFVKEKPLSVVTDEIIEQSKRDFPQLMKQLKKKKDAAIKSLNQ